MAEVIIDGYTDTTGEYADNLDLSQRRAYAVAAYLLSNMYNFLPADQCEELMSKLTANGKSESNPIMDGSGNIDMDASRRVEIKFRLKDTEMIERMGEILSTLE